MKPIKKPLGHFLALITKAAAATTFLVMAFLILYILINGLPHLTPSLFEFKYTTKNVSMFPALVSTIIMTALSLIIAVPLGAFAGIYLVEYAKKGNRTVKVVRVTAEALSGIPSIVYGLFGMMFFVTYLKWGNSILAGAFTLSIMVLPLIMRTTEEALKSVPDSYREGSFGLGAGRLHTIFKVVLPSAVPGILAGVILSIGRIIGETAALIYTAGTVTEMPQNVFSSARTLSVHMWALTGESLHKNESYAAGVVLLILVVGINSFSAFIAKKFIKEGK
ncbi:MAG: phosphate ABC transporter permease PstA [Clostridiales bacterium]|jgi:phosphate transport system permease protein|nr:phosphate ABC transporter permease PstA [Clostridiales bacterium]